MKLLLSLLVATVGWGIIVSILLSMSGCITLPEVRSYKGPVVLVTHDPAEFLRNGPCTPISIRQVGDVVYLEC